MNHVTRNTYQKGFTLIEVLVVVAISVVCIVVLSSLFIGQNRIYRVETAELNVTADARQAVDDIDNYVRLATRTQSSYSTYTASSNVLILKIQSVNASNQLIAGTFDYVVYYLSGTSLLRQIFSDATSSRSNGIKKLANNVNGLSFTLNNVDYSLVTQVTTDITIQENAGVQTRAITLSSKSRLRNY